MGMFDHFVILVHCNAHILVIVVADVITVCFYCVQLEEGIVNIKHTVWTDTCPALGDVLFSTLVWYTCRTVNGRLQLIISGQADLAVYQQLLRTVRYSSTSLEPDKDSLTLTVSVGCFCVLKVFSFAI